jgi:hypothetical protein
MVNLARVVGALAVVAPVVAIACGEVTPQPETPAPKAAAQAAADAGAAPSPASSALAAPGPAALPCTNDAMCMTHRCNVKAGKCAFPCESDFDCQQGSTCFKSAISTCVPKPAASTQ